MIRLTLETPSGYLTIQFLEWLSERPRTYGDVMDAWRTSCPRLSSGKTPCLPDSSALARETSGTEASC